jgi:3,4-dihydroxy 2-butanone 4-phosphate synthase/GTP cyclohydrolase II
MSSAQQPTARASGLATTQELIEELAQARPIIVVDDEDRENEGDLIMAADHVTPEQMAFTIRHTGGVVCLAMPNSLADHLELPAMVQNNTARLKTAYTVSIEAKHGVTTGISAQDRVTTIRTTVSRGVTAADLTRPGHVFPLRARDRGVLERTGHTEAAVDLCRLAGLSAVGAISELMHDDGTLMRLPAILDFARTHGLRVGTIADLVAYRLRTESFVTHVATARLPTEHGEFDVHGFRDELRAQEHLALSMGDIRDGRPVLVRVHSECLTGDTLGSLRCDCGPQRVAALQRIAAEGRGVLLYLRQEGRGIGLLNKLRAYALQDGGADTVEANTQLGFGADERDYAAGAQILRALGIEQVQLMTNNPHKLAGLTRFGTRVVERVPLLVGGGKHNRRYLATKAEKLGHILYETRSLDRVTPLDGE